MSRVPSKLTITATCCTVLAAGAAAGAVTLRPGPHRTGQISESLAIAARVTDTTGSASTAGQAANGLAISSFEIQHARATAASDRRASELAIRAQARAAARAARARAARQRAARQQAAQAAAAPAASSSPTAAPAPSAPAVASGSPQQVAMSLLSSYGWSSVQFSCLDDLWTRESGWNPTAENASGAYGIPQALPGSKMASAGADWQTDATTQIRWGLGYIKGLYGSPCGAWSHEQSTGWY